ncbi:nucleotide sugar dehydrogenase [Nonomuraea sp. NPDC049758]|uniref:UDP-glucose dehydrogenase family protein n=1 Tax=Nonomuraea sp. NPDC049758 TaxID=3154360 RepID=UPI003419EE5E
MMRVSVIGCGHLGAPHAAAMAELGHEVIGVELDPEKCKSLGAGVAPFYEAGFAELLAAHTATGQLRFTTDLGEAADFADLHFIAVGTPLRPDGDGYDTSQVIGAVEALLPLLPPRPATIVGKSTVTVGTVAQLQHIIDEFGPAARVDLVWNPEFLREGHAIEDTLRPDRIVAGLSSPEARAAIEEVYAPILASGVAELIVTDPATAEVLKSAANAFLSTKISFINAMAEVCEITGADVNTVAYGIGIDKRIGHGGMRPGIGYGGGCLPKDVRAFTHRVGELGAHDAYGLLTAVEHVNEGRGHAAAELVEKANGGPLDGSRIAFLGTSFKAGTSDVRDSPALRLARRLVERGATPAIYDPEALDAARIYHPEFTYADTVADALQGADLVVIGTEWPQFTHDPDLPDEAAAVVRRRVLVDVRNAVDAGPWILAGWQVWQLGRPAQHPPYPTSQTPWRLPMNMETMWTQIRALRERDERRSHAPDPAKELLLVTKVSEEANEAAELYRRWRGWGTDGPQTATLAEVQDELCAAILAGMVTLDRISPDKSAGSHWERYLAYGFQRAARENAAAAAE